MPRIPNQTTSIVQAAHIHQHAVSGNDDPCNGLALTPDAHWMFDARLWTAIPKNDDFLINIAQNRSQNPHPTGVCLPNFTKHHSIFMNTRAFGRPVHISNGIET